MKKILKKILPSWIRAWLLKLWFSGPSFKKYKNLWVLEDGNSKISIPFLERYGLFAHGINQRLNHMLKRYDLGDINDALILDVGAHIGEFALAASPYAKHIICFEPDPSAREALLTNVQDIENIEVLSFALSNRSGLSTFYAAPDFADSSLFKPFGVSSIEMELETKKLDDLNLYFDGYSRLVLKMDAEGFEPEVVEGGIKVFSKLDQVAIDVSPERGNNDTYEDVSKALVNTGLVEKKLSSDMVLVCHRVLS